MFVTRSGAAPHPLQDDARPVRGGRFDRQRL